MKRNLMCLLAILPSAVFAGFYAPLQLSASPTAANSSLLFKVSVSTAGITEVDVTATDGVVSGNTCTDPSGEPIIGAITGQGRTFTAGKNYGVSSVSTYNLLHTQGNPESYTCLTVTAVKIGQLKINTIDIAEAISCVTGDDSGTCTNNDSPATYKEIGLQ